VAAIGSFFTWMQTQDPARMAGYQDILAIPASKHDRPAVGHLSVQQTRHLLALPDRSTRNGRRDAALLARRDSLLTVRWFLALERIGCSGGCGSATRAPAG